ncbi:MAG: DUF4258 domain-containing protein [Planctomycetes bacterium]|nr:DUF4258 domain-containing protein [Planctomycetota bacterium]
MDATILREVMETGNVEWRKHALIRIAERGISRQHVLDTLRHGEVIEQYEGDQPFESALFLWTTEDSPLHVVAALDNNTPMV